MGVTITARSTITASTGRWMCDCGDEGTGFDEAFDHGLRHTPNRTLIRFVLNDAAFTRPLPEPV